MSTITAVKQISKVQDFANIPSGGIMTLLCSAPKFKQFLMKIDIDTLKSATQKHSRSPIGLLISPWNDTSVPWYSLTALLLLMQRGFPGFIIWDDLDFESDILATATQQQAISQILDIFHSWDIKIHRLSAFTPAPLSQHEEELIDKAAYLNALWIESSSLPTIKLEETSKKCLLHFKKNVPYISSYLSNLNPSRIIIPGGVYRHSGIFLHLGKYHDHKITTYDCNPLSLMIGHDEVACWFADLPKTFFELNSAPPDAQLAIRKEAKNEFLSKLSGTDKRQYQRVQPKHNGKIETYDVFIPMNIDTDSTTLGRSRFFKSSWYWLTSTIRFILDNTSATIVVRQHPHEALKPGNRAIYTDTLRLLFPSSRVRFISCYEKINSYDLLKKSKLILPYVSTMGIEAAMIGKQVIIESMVYYAELPFVQQAKTLNDYYELITQAINTPRDLSMKEIDAAWNCYYLSAVCCRIWTDFIPLPTKFEQWSKRSLDELASSKEVQDIISALNGEQPVTRIMHNNIIGNKYNFTL